VTSSFFPKQSKGRCASQAGCLAGVFVYVWWIIRPRLIYDVFGIYLPYPEFSLERTHLGQALAQPGGAAECLAAFLAQWFYDSCAGAFIITAVAWLIWNVTDRLISDVGGCRCGFPNLFPLCAVLLLYQSYHHPLASLLALAICLWFAVAFRTMPVHAMPLVGTSVFLVLCAVLYQLAGAASLLFALLIGIVYVHAEHRPVQGLCFVAAGAAMPWLVGTRLLPMTAPAAYSLLLPVGTESAGEMEPLPLNLLRALFLFPALASFLAVIRRTRHPTPAAEWNSGTPGGTRVGNLPSAACLRRLANLLVLAGTVAAIAHFQRRPHRERRFEMVHHTRLQEWDHVLQVARRLPDRDYGLFCNHLANRALYHTGRLGDEMFSFPQQPQALLLLAGDAPDSPPKYWMLAETAFELGNVSLCEQ
jgi:hypothetical protein